MAKKTPSIYKQRLREIHKQLSINKIDALIIDNLIDIFYLTGMELSAGRLLITSRGSRLFVDGRYYEVCSTAAPCAVTLLTPKALTQALKKLCPKSGKSLVGFDSQATNYATFQALRRDINAVNRASKSSGKLTLHPCQAPVEPLRLTKDASELRALRKAARLGCKGFEYVCSILKAGISEIDVARALEIFWLENGGAGLAFDPIIAFGANGSQPHYHPGKAKLRKGQPVLVDCGVTVDHYHSDMTRVVFFGKPHKEMEHIYGIVKDAQAAALALCKPGTAIHALDAAARDLITKEGYGDKFSHSLGHGIGLEVHESPGLHARNTKESLAEGMVITIEPGIYLPGLGGVRIEDTVIITAKGHENLTPLSKALTVL